MSDFPYEDIVNLPHHQSKTHKHMSREKRAAQFAPFAALAGYDEAIMETARLTDAEIILAEDARERLDDSLQELRNAPDSFVTLTWFNPDTHKSGGSYITRTSQIKRIDDITRALVLIDGTVIPVDKIKKLSIEKQR